MALSAVSTVVGKLADLALKKALKLYDVSDQVDPMKMELNLITGFLKDADAKCNKNRLVKQWVNELRDLAYRIEDALDTFLVDIEENKLPSSTMIRKLLRFGTKPKKVNDLCAEIKKITMMLETLYERGTQLGIKDINEENHPIPAQFRPAKPSDIDDSEVVGLDSEKEQIISRLLDRSISKRTVLSVVGTGGLGKTTLAHKVYKSVWLMGKFDRVTWQSISQKWNETNLLRELLCSIKPTMKRKNPPLTNEDLLEELKSSLSGQRYLLILDDMWTIDLWERLKIALPDPNNASRVLITTRNLDVALAADCNTEPFKPRYLDDDESLSLLFRKAFQQPIQPDNYPPDIKMVAKRLIKKCGGLPLALIVLGGILSRRARNCTAWQEVEKTLDWHDKEGEKCSKILALSYEDLHYELKPCFLYFASFPEDHLISANHITKMWVAEGFIPKDGAGTLEDRAKNCLAELVQRCLVHINRISSSGRCKSCKMHDLLRDLAIHEAKNANFLTVFSEAENRSQVDITVTRRAALHSCTSMQHDLILSKTRSLIWFGKYMSSVQGFRLLRVLNFERTNGIIENLHLGRHAIRGGWLNCLTHLRFFGIRHCSDYPRLYSVSFSHLKNFETLDLTGSLSEPSDSLWTVPTLRNVISTHPIVGPSQWKHLKNIQTLKWVRYEKIPILEEKNSLRKIGVLLVKSQIWEQQITSIEEERHVKGESSLNSPSLPGSMIQKTNVWHILNGLLKWAESLTSLSVRTDEPEVKLMFGADGTHDLPCHTKLQKLDLTGQWAIAPSVEMLPTNLVKLALRGSMLQEDPMPVLERLQCLRILQLSVDSYCGTKLICSAGGFPRLEKLKLLWLPKLSEWDIKEGAMPILNHLTIDGCDMLQTIPELRNLPSLQELIIDHPSIELNRRMKSDDRSKIEHIPCVRILHPSD